MTSYEIIIFQIVHQQTMQWSITTELLTVLDRHSPVTFSLTAPWFTALKSAGGAFEQQFKQSSIPLSWLIENTKKSTQSPLERYYSDIIQNSPGNSKQLFSTINHLLKPRTPSPTDVMDELCNNYLTFFKLKIDSITPCRWDKFQQL